MTGRYLYADADEPSINVVSILARSGDRALHRQKFVDMSTRPVSILARSGDRALRQYANRKVFTRLFQSSPGLVTGRYPNFDDDIPF